MHGNVCGVVPRRYDAEYYKRSRLTDARPVTASRLG